MIGFEPVIAIAGSQRGWASELVRFLSDFGGARLKGTVLTATEALQTEYEVLLIDDITSFLSPRLVDRIQKAGRKVVGIFDPDSGELGRERLLALGVDGMAPAGGGPETILEIVATWPSTACLGHVWEPPRSASRLGWAASRWWPAVTWRLTWPSYWRELSKPASVWRW